MYTHANECTHAHVKAYRTLQGIDQKFMGVLSKLTYISTYAFSSRYIHTHSYIHIRHKRICRKIKNNHGCPVHSYIHT